MVATSPTQKGRQHKIIDGKEYCNCTNCENTTRKFSPPDSYYMGHPVYGSTWLTHFREEDNDN